MPYMEGKAEILQIIDVYEEDRGAGVFLLDVRCLETGRRFTDGYHPAQLQPEDIRQVLCPHCRLWHELRMESSVHRRLMRSDQIRDLPKRPDEP